MTRKENEELNNRPDDEKENEGILALAEAVLGEPDKAHLSLEETGAAEELLALASEASLSSPINRETVQTPFEAENNISQSNAVKPPKHVCNNCSATSTPFWRKSSDGFYYCNACGLYLRTHNAMRPLSLSKNRESRRGKMRPELCGNCGATDTPMWRKTEDGMVVCNACGLYHKLHGQHRRVGSKRSIEKKVELPTKKSTRSNDFTLVRENSQIAAKVSSMPAPTVAAKYSLDNHYHHKFDPSRVNNNNSNNNSNQSGQETAQTAVSVLPVVEVQPVDVRKLAYLKCSQGRTALLAPKLPATSDQQPVQNPSIASSPMPPILTNFINSLASTSPDNLTADQVEHPLQPLLTSIVSQKLKEQKIKYQRKSSSPTIQDTTNIPMQIYHHQMQQQQLQQQHENYSQLAEFIQSQQQALYNQQMIQQAIYNHVNENGGYGYNPEYDNPNGYDNYQQDNETQYPNNSHNNINNMNLQYEMNNQQQYALNNQQAQVINMQYAHQNIQQIPNIQSIQNVHSTQNIQQIHNMQNIQNMQNMQNVQNMQNMQNMQNVQNMQNMQNIMPQLPQISQLQQMPQITPYSHHDSNHQQGVYFTEQFPDPPLRQLSPFSGIKFDKNLIELVNMQFWQDNNSNTNPDSNSSDQNNTNNNNSNPF